jgi:hypothetical protein
MVDLPTFRDNESRQKFKCDVVFTAKLLKMRGIGCLETSVKIYISAVRKIPEERGSQLQSG